MRAAKLSMGPVVLWWLAGWCLLAAGDPSVGQEDPRQPYSPQLGSENWPHPTKSVTLVPSFTKTPRPTTTPPQKHTTTHHHHRHTTTAPANYTTHHATTTPKKPTTTHHAATTTTPKKPTTTHHAATTTTPKKPTTTHHAATTTAPANHTSASHPTTHRHTTAHQKHTTGRHSATTTAPANHTSAPHSTTTAAPRPTQPPDVPVGNYSVKQGAGVCLRAEMGLQMRIRYADQAKRQVWGAFAVEPKHTNVSGTCADKTATLKLHFPEGFILFTFEKNQTEKTAYLSQVQANLTYQFPQATEKTFRANNASLREFAAPLGKSYQCRNRSLALSESFHLTALSERVQAFQLQDGKFGEAEVCPEQKRSVVLPIVVGVIILILIIIVLVAFAVGRWRARTGYESL